MCGNVGYKIAHWNDCIGGLALLLLLYDMICIEEPQYSQIAKTINVAWWQQQRLSRNGLALTTISRTVLTFEPWMTDCDDNNALFNFTLHLVSQRQEACSRSADQHTSTLHGEDTCMYIFCQVFPPKIFLNL